MKKTALVSWVLALLVLDPGLPAQDAQSFKLVINAENPTETVETKIVGKMFLKILPRWEDWEIEGQGKVRVVPVDQAPDSEIREAFSRAVHGRSVSAVINYWQRQIYSGRGYPPDQLRNDEDVLEHVRNQPGAVGYVSAAARLGDGVKELKTSPPAARNQDAGRAFPTT